MARGQYCLRFSTRGVIGEHRPKFKYRMDIMKLRSFVINSGKIASRNADEIILYALALLTQLFRPWDISRAVDCIAALHSPASAFFSIARLRLTWSS